MDKKRVAEKVSQRACTMLFPKFKYDSIRQIATAFEQGFYLFTWDLKDGYFHLDMVEHTFTYMCFEWKGQVYYFAQCPNGLAPACWASTKLVGVAIRYLRSQGLRCLRYIDDGIGGARRAEETQRYSDMVAEVLGGMGWVLSIDKGGLTPQQQAEFIGYLIDTVGAGEGYLCPSSKRERRLLSAAELLLRNRTVSARQVAQFTGHVVSLRPVLDPTALLFTRELYLFTDSVVREHSWGWRVELGEGAREEVQLWLRKFEQWKREPIWKLGQPAYVQAQDASDTGWGGWPGEFEAPQLQTVHGQQHRVVLPEAVERAAGMLQQQDVVRSSTGRTENCQLTVCGFRNR